MKDNNMRQHWIQFIEKYFPAIVLVMFAISYLSFYALHNTLVSLILFIMTFLFVIPLAIFENEIDDNNALLMSKRQYQDETYTFQ